MPLTTCSIIIPGFAGSHFENNSVILNNIIHYVACESLTWGDVAIICNLYISVIQTFSLNDRMFKFKQVIMNAVLMLLSFILQCS